MNIGNELTPPRAVKKMNEVAAGMRDLEYVYGLPAPGERVRHHVIYEGGATIDECRINGSVVSAIYDTEDNVQNMLITLPGGRELLVPFAPLEAGLGQMWDGSGRYFFTDDWTYPSVSEEAIGQSVASLERWYQAELFFQRITTVAHPVGNRILRLQTDDLGPMDLLHASVKP